MQNYHQSLTLQKQNSPFLTELPLRYRIIANKLMQKQKNCIFLHWFCMKMHLKINTEIQTGRNWEKPIVTTLV